MMQTTLTRAADERAAWTNSGSVPAFLVLAALFALADAGSSGLLVSAALSAATLVLYFFPDLGR